MKNSTKLLVFIIGLMMIPAWLFANVRLPQVLSSNMVIQRNMEIRIWGWADKGEKVSVEFAGKTLKARADKNGEWMVTFPPMKEGGPYSLNVTGKNKVVLDNILMGDVWICSGQSNMEFQLHRAKDAVNEIAKADYPEIRLLNIPNNLQLSTVDDVPETSWMICTPENVENFSAVGYFFGRDIQKEVGVPVGLISTNWGGTNVEAWTSKDYITTVEEFRHSLDDVDQNTFDNLKIKQEEVIAGLMKEFEISDNTGGKPADYSAENIDMSLWKEMKVPGYWERRNLPGVDGTVWFRTSFELPASASEKEAVLNLGKIDDSDYTFVNGVKVGESINKYDKLRSYTLSPGILKPGKNVIAVKVVDDGGNGGFSGPAAQMNITSGSFTLPLDGTWHYRLTGEGLKYSPTTMSPNEKPATLYNGMIYPLLNLRVKGAIWYQGEANAGRAYQYRYLFPLMIRCWRDKFQEADMPFLFVQLANYMAVKTEPGESDWAELREAQTGTLDSLKNTGMAVIIDIGEANDIHPTNKQDVGYRLAMNALKIAYNMDVESMGPLYKSVEFKDGKAIISFSHEGSGLMVKDKYGYLKGFAIAGADKKFHWAKAVISDGKIIASCSEVKNPVAVRYAWANNPDDANLYNKEGLPASPFRSDDWPGITAGIK